MLPLFDRAADTTRKQTKTTKQQKKGVARIICSMSRTHLLFPGFGKINRKFLTPMNSTLLVIVATLPLAILTDLPALINLGEMAESRGSAGSENASRASRIITQAQKLTTQ